MSTSIYATIKLVGNETTPEVRMHLGSMGNNIVAVDGNNFPTFQFMVDFLKHNEDRTTIETEYGVTMTVDEFAKEMRSYDKVARARQYRMSGGEHSTVRQYNKVAGARSALDPEGFTMSTGIWF